jgi:hypothetical protein
MLVYIYIGKRNMYDGIAVETWWNSKCWIITACKIIVFSCFNDLLESSVLTTMRILAWLEKKTVKKRDKIAVKTWWNSKCWIIFVWKIVVFRCFNDLLEFSHYFRNVNYNAYIIRKRKNQWKQDKIRKEFE